MTFARKHAPRVRSYPSAIPESQRRNAVFARMDVPAAPPIEKEGNKPGKGATNKEEREWMAAIVEHGCIACILDGQQPRETAVHHILSGGRRKGHLFTLPLCDPGHHQGGRQLGMVSRHPDKARFEQQYGTELELLEVVQARIKGGLQ